MASSVAFPNAVVQVQRSTAGLSLEFLTVEAKTLIAEAEQFVLDGNGALLPAGWADQIRLMIGEAEAIIRGDACEQASHVSEFEHEATRPSWDSAGIYWQAKEQVSYRETYDISQGAALGGVRRRSADSGILAELGNHHASMEQRFVQADTNPALEAIQEDIYALTSVLSMQMADFQSLKQRQVSELALFSVLEEAFEILMDLNDQVDDLYQPSNGMGEGLAHGILQLRLDALPLQLQAVFNMDCQERERQGEEIGDDEMVAMVLQNQKRTEMLRAIQDVLGRKLEVSREKRNDRA